MDIPGLGEVTVKIRMLTTAAGPSIGVLTAGQIVDVDDMLGQALVGSKYAEEISLPDGAEAQPETAELPSAPETAELPRPRARRGRP
jgi:hypothetical protein